MATARDFFDPACFDIREEDLTLFRKTVGDFVPPNAFDAHAHWYDLKHVLNEEQLRDTGGNGSAVSHAAMSNSIRRWMGELAIEDGLFFPVPVKHLDCNAANEFLATALSDRPNSRGLMIIRPDDDPDAVEQTLIKHRFSGFKVYHVFAERPDTFHSEQGEFLTEWAWEIADKHALWITMHMVLPRALSDPKNSSYIIEHCLKYPSAKLVLAHAARGFNAGHTINAIDLLRGIDNVFFDTSAVCEAGAFEAIIRATGTTRLMYGSDFPISEIRGTALSLGDGFFWLYSHSADFAGWEHGRPSPVGMESLIALKRACRTMCLNDNDVERIFSTNARQLLGIEAASNGDELRDLYEHAKTIIPGGTQLLSKRPEMFAPQVWPAYYEQAIGCEVVDPSGRRFLDMSLGGILATILGYSDPDVNAAVIRRVTLGSMATQQTSDEVRLAELLLEIHPWAQQARFCRTGGESMAAAVRIARAATGRDNVAICGYHGWHDWYLASNLGPTDDALVGHLLPGLEPNGVPKGLAGTAFTFHYNNLDELDSIIKEHGHDLAAIVMEPTRQSDPEPGFLEGVRSRADELRCKLIFDEISIGWRLCLGGSHLLYGIDPDIAVFAKTISNGFAMGAIIGNASTMQAAQSTFVSSAYWTEGIGPAAAVATIEKLKRLDVPTHLSQLGQQMIDGWQTLGQKHQLPTTTGARTQSVTLGFEHPQANALMTLYTTRMIEHGILAGASFNPTYAHRLRHVDWTLAQADKVFKELATAVELNDIHERLDGPEKHTMFARLT